MGDFAILVHAGLSRPRALLLNLATGLASVIGSVAAYYGLRRTMGVLPYALAFAAAGFLYIAVAGLIPGLHRRADPRTSAIQVILIALGIGVIAWAERLTQWREGRRQLPLPTRAVPERVKLRLNSRPRGFASGYHLT